MADNFARMYTLYVYKNCIYIPSTIYIHKKYINIDVPILYAWYYNCCSSLNRGHCRVVLLETLTPPPLVDCIVRVYLYMYIILCTCAHVQTHVYVLLFFIIIIIIIISAASLPDACARALAVSSHRHTPHTLTHSARARCTGQKQLH